MDFQNLDILKTETYNVSVFRIMFGYKGTKNVEIYVSMEIVFPVL